MLTEDNFYRLFGSSKLPLISPGDPFSDLLIGMSYRVERWVSYQIDTTKRIRRGPFGVYIEKSISKKLIILMNALYVIEANRKYKVGMGPKYSGLTTFLTLLGIIKVKAYPENRQVRKVYPLVISDLNFRAFYVELLEIMAACDMAGAVLLLESKFSPLTLVI